MTADAAAAAREGVDVRGELDEIRAGLAAVCGEPLLKRWNAEADGVTDSDLVHRYLPEALGRLDALHLRVEALELQARLGRDDAAGRRDGDGR